MPKSNDLIALEVIDRLGSKESLQLGVQTPCHPKAQSLVCGGSFQCHLLGFGLCTKNLNDCDSHLALFLSLASR